MIFDYAYAIIQKEDNFCSQVNKNNNPSWVLDNDAFYNLPLPVEHAERNAGKYYYDDQWWKREWNTVETTDSGGNVVLLTDGTYVDYPFDPSVDVEEDELVPMVTVSAEELLRVIVEGE